MAVSREIVRIRTIAACLLLLLLVPSRPAGRGALLSLPLSDPGGGARLTIPQLWAIAAGANLLFQDSRFDHLELGGTAAEARDMLRQQWRVTGPSAAEPLLDSLATVGHTAVLRAILPKVSALTPPRFEQWVAEQRPDLRRLLRFAYEHRTEFKDGELLGWDLARLINVARAEYKVGWIDEATAWKHIMPAARRLQRAYSSWQELSDNYLLGRRFWGGHDETQPRFETRARWLTTDPHSPWRRLAWNTPLG
jgi:Protein of unknown function (DUF1266)